MGAGAKKSGLRHRTVQEKTFERHLRTEEVFKSPGDAKKALEVPGSRGICYHLNSEHRADVAFAFNLNFLYYSKTWL